MGILAEFSSGPTPPPKATIGTTGRPTDLFLSGGLLPMHLELLWAIVLEKDWDVNLMDDFTQLGESDGNQWLVKLPDELVSRVSTASPAELRQLQVKWAATDEMSVNPEDLDDVMAGLLRLAKRAVESGRSMYLWGSL